MRSGGRHARFDGPTVWPRSRRFGLLCHPCGLHLGCHHRHGGGSGHCHGHDFFAGHDSLRLQHALCHGCIGGLRHHHAVGPAFIGLGGHGRSIGSVCGRHVQGRLGPFHSANSFLCALHLLFGSLVTAPCAGRSKRGPHLEWLGPLEKVFARHHSLCSAHFCSAGQHGRLARH